MEQQTKWYRRRPLYGVLVVALVALAIPVSLAIAGTGSKVTVPVVKYPNNCSYYPKNKVVGSATFERTKSGAVIVTYTLKGGTPLSTYDWGVESDTPVPCTFISNGDTYFTSRTDTSGQFRETQVVPEAAGKNDFWIYATGPDANRSAVAHV